MLNNNYMDKTNTIDDFNRDYQMLNYFQSEFLYRHKHFWSVLIKSFILVLSTTIIPIVSEVFGIVFNNIIQRFLFIFPIIGILLAIGSFLILLDEGKKINAVNTAKYRINQTMDEKYQYYFYTKFNNGNFRDIKTNKRKKGLTVIIPIFLLILELIIAVVIIMILISNIWLNV